MSHDADFARIHTDGAARGNPGPAAWAFVIESPELGTIEHAESFGSATNNVAEYKALVAALERAHQLGLHRIQILSDSELLVQQMNGVYRVKNPDLRELYDQATRWASRFQSVRYAHIRREENRRADQLCNLALDGGKARATASESRKAKSAAPAARKPDLDAHAIDCLRAAAETWARSGAASLEPALIWDQLWTLLEEHQVLKSRRAKS